MKLAGQVTEKDYVASQWLHLRPRPIFKILLTLLLVLLMWVMGIAIHQWLNGKGWEPAVGWVFGGILYFALILGVVRPYKFRKIYRESKLLHDPFEWEFSDQGLVCKSVKGEARLSWDDFLKWREGKDLILLYQNRALMNILPKRGFESPESLEATLTLIRKKMGKAV